MTPPRVTATLAASLVLCSCSVARPTPARTDDGGEQRGIAVSHQLRSTDAGHHLELSADDRRIIVPNAQSLLSQTANTVTVEAQALPDGVLLHLNVRNETGVAVAMPDLTISGIELPRNDIELLENWKTVRFKQPSARNQHQLHALRAYPSEVYSPVMGMRHDGLFLASSIMYPVFETNWEVNLDYRYDRRAQTWTMWYRFWDDGFLSDSSRNRTDAALLEPGEEISFSVAVTVAPADRWVEAFHPYRDSFRATYGTVRYTASREPINALPLGLASRISTSNPKGYGPAGPAGHGRLDLVGWRGFFQRVMDDMHTWGYRRIMLWQVGGIYPVHRNTNMVWEIASSWSPIMYETAHELRRLHTAGITIGFWWGRAFSISGGFDSGQRHPWDPDNEEDNAAAFRELDRAYDMGVRMIGMDDTPKRPYRRDWNPGSDVLFLRIFPMLHERYPDMHWVIEPAACDYLHLWGSTYLWASDITAPTEFADYLVPGHESHAVIKPSRPLPNQSDRHDHMNRQLLRQLIRWGYTPIVFHPENHDLPVPREIVESAAR